MARLSVEHYRANAAMTPENTRKSSRFRDMFKSRSSMSPPVVPTNSDKKSLTEIDSPAPPVSPTSPTVKAGFEQVGLLPSERTSLTDAKRELENYGGHHVVEVLEQQEKDLKGVSVSHDLDTALDGASVGHQDRAAKQALQKSREEEADVIAEAFQKSLSEHGVAATEHNEDHQKAVSFDEGPLHTLRRTKSQEHLKDFRPTDTVITGSNFNCDSNPDAYLQSVRHAVEHGRHNSLPPEEDIGLSSVSGKGLYNADTAAEAGPAFKPQGSDMFDNGLRSILDEGSEGADMPSSTRSSFASNIFDRDDPLSQGIREYVASKIAQATVGLERNYTEMLAEQELKYHEALKNQERKYIEMLTKLRLRPVHITVNMDMTSEVKTEVVSTMPRGQVFGGSASVCNVKFADYHPAFAIQLLIVIGLLALTIASFRYSLACPSSTMLKVWMLLRLYKAALMRANSVHRSDDIFVAPMEYMEDLIIWGTGNATQFMLQAATKVLAEMPGTVLEVRGDDDKA